MSFYSENRQALAEFIFDKALPYLENIQRLHGNDTMVEHAYFTVDDLLDKSGIWDRATCKKGCSFCCHDEIKMSNFEAAYITRRIKEEGVKPNRSRLKKQQRVQDYKTLKWKDQACAMLDEDGTCMIYPIRPMVCRTHNSIGPVSLCDKRIDPDSVVPEGRGIQSEGIVMALLKLDNIENDSQMPSMHKILK